MAAAHPRFPVDQALLDAFCSRWHVEVLALFGSSARGEARPDSDVDVMVEFSPGASPGLWAFAQMREELEELTGKPVDLVTKASIRNPFRMASINRDLLIVFRAA
jgi:predicted nucleotidyltransferase